ncbi:MAG: cytochrome c3 family protein [Thermodesulfovibrionales bacterium]|nr:cytochrome c3 family protein [Thermodesulfovibrionales bacterium]
MNKAALPFALVLILTLAGCLPKQPAHEEKAEEETPVMSRYAGISSLPCFGCHSPGAFFNAAESGVFSHAGHASFEVHCNQCHDASGHEPIVMGTEKCGSCHSLRMLAYEGGGMGRVTFRHESHTKTFQCLVCHTKVFPLKKGLKNMKMDDMYAGKSCGTCHDGIKAFSSMECNRCHRQG